MITIAIAEDHLSVMDGIELLLRYEDNFEIVGTVTNGEDLIELVTKKQPRIVLTDIRMPRIDGIAATKIIKKRFPHVKVIALSMFDQENAIKEMKNAGASGYLIKHSPLKEILNAISVVLDGKEYYDAAIDLSILDNDNNTQQKKSLLTKSEKAILRLIAQGKTSSEIAAERFTAVSTVEKHRKNMIKKLGLEGRTALYDYAKSKQYNFDL